MSCKLHQAKVGDEVSMTVSIGKYQPIYYAGASGDFNWIHIDPEFGKMVGLGGNILQGLCTMAFVARAHTDLAEDPGRLKRLKVRFSKPVYPNDDISVKGKITKAENDTLRTDVVAVNQNGIEVITMAWAELSLK